MMHIIKREAMPFINAVVMDGAMHPLGIVKDFRKHEKLNAYMPDLSRVSLSWVHLGEDCVLEAHHHPTTSMIIVTQGKGKVTGDLEKLIEAGDTIIVPPHTLHGFRGGTPEGFWALSLQFEGAGLYEDVDKPRTSFFAPKPSPTKEKLIFILEKQEEYLQKYLKNPLILLLKSEEIKKKDVREKLLECLQFWSNAFQKILLARGVFAVKPLYQHLAQKHLREEIGHNLLLAQSRQASESCLLWDPLLAAISAWFLESMISLSEIEKLVLIHFVLEGSGDIFHKEALPVFPDMPYFSLHAVEDEDHFQMGCDVLANLENFDADKFCHILDKGWTMMNLLCHQMAKLSLNASTAAIDGKIQDVSQKGSKAAPRF